VRKLLADALRAFVALPDDDWQPHDWHIAMEAKRLAGEELARLDRAAARKPARGGSGLSMGKRAADGPTGATRQFVEARSRGYCEVGSLGCLGRGNHLHHRLMRSQGGGHEADNLLNVCRHCHDLIHAEPMFAYERGWLLHRVTA